MSILLVYRPRGVNFAFLGDMSVIDSRQRNFDTLEHGRLRMQRQHWLKEEATKSIFHETFFLDTWDLLSWSWSWSRFSSKILNPFTEPAPEAWENPDQGNCPTSVVWALHLLFTATTYDSLLVCHAAVGTNTGLGWDYTHRPETLL
jgi:hypothetical protein